MFSGKVSSQEESWEGSEEERHWDVWSGRTGRMGQRRWAEPEGVCVRGLGDCGKTSCGNSCLNCWSWPALLTAWCVGRGDEVRNVPSETCSQCVELEELAWCLRSAGRQSSGNKLFKKLLALFCANAIFICCPITSGTRFREENASEKEVWIPFLYSLSPGVGMFF